MSQRDPPFELAQIHDAEAPSPQVFFPISVIEADGWEALELEGVGPEAVHGVFQILLEHADAGHYGDDGEYADEHSQDGER